MKGNSRPKRKKPKKNLKNELIQRTEELFTALGGDKPDKWIGTTNHPSGAKGRLSSLDISKSTAVNYVLPALEKFKNMRAIHKEDAEKIK